MARPPSLAAMARPPSPADVQAVGDDVAYVCVWDATQRECPEVARLYLHESAVFAIAFSADGSSLMSVGAERSGSVVAVWDWAAATGLTPSSKPVAGKAAPIGTIATGVHGRDRPYGACFRVGAGMVTYGSKGAKFWSVDGSKLLAERARFGDQRQMPKAVLCCMSVTDSGGCHPLQAVVSVGWWRVGWWRVTEIRAMRCLWLIVSGALTLVFGLVSSVVGAVVGGLGLG